MSQRTIYRFAWVLLLASTAAAQTLATFEHGVVIPRVECAGKPEQSYALYLPSNYTPSRKWPVLFAFDPAARGRLPVERAKEAAEKYGYIVAGSNNSQNGPARPQVEAAEAMIQDVAARFSLDARRVYATGFSGGSRVASMMALICGECIAGVMAQGAGLPTSTAPSKDIHFAYFATVGDVDFNYPEIVQLTDRLEELGVPTHLRVFAGSHQWAPEEIWQEAIAWFELRGMAEGRRPRDEDFIARQLSGAAESAAKLESAGDIYHAYLADQQLVRDFDGLADVSPYAAKVAAWKDSDAVHDGIKQQQKDIERQHALTTAYFSTFVAMRDSPVERGSLLPQLYSAVNDLKRGAESKSREESKVPQRAIGHAFAQTYEAGDTAMRNKEYTLAEICYKLARELRPDSPGPPFELARLQAVNGHKKQALEALRESVRKGLRSAALLRTTPEFDSLREDPKFQKILQSLEKESAPQP